MEGFCKRNEMISYKERQILLLECVMIFLRFMIMIGISSDNIYETIMVHIMTFLSKPNLIFHYSVYDVPFVKWHCNIRYACMNFRGKWTISKAIWYKTKSVNKIFICSGWMVSQSRYKAVISGQFTSFLCKEMIDQTF